MKPLLADSCEANFKESGDPRNGAGYVTYRTIPNLDPHSALGQMEKIVLDEGFVMGSESYDGDIGTLIVSQKSHRSLLHPRPGYPVMIRANKATNQLAIALQLNQGETTDPAALRTQLCGMLNKVTMDAAGNAAAAAEHAATHSDEIINIKAIDLAGQLTRKPFSLPLKPQDLAAKYVGRVYRIDGQVSVLMTPGEALARAQAIQNGSNTINIAYNTTKPALGGSLLGGTGRPQTAIICHSDPSQLARFMALRNNDYATLIGKVVQFTGDQYSGTLYMDCHFEN